jgi:ABC-2 type transport system permease protein
MANLWLVAKHDMGVTLRQRSFWIMTLFMPALLLGMIALDVREEVGADFAARSEESIVATAIPTIGLVDEARVITTIPADIPQQMFQRYATIASAREAMQAGVIEQILLLPQDYMASGKVTIYDENFVIRENGQGMGIAFNGGQQWALQRLIATNLVEDEQLLNALQDPLSPQNSALHRLAPNERVDTEDNTLSRVITIGLPYIFYFLLLMGSGYLLRSVTTEKENRTAELLLLRLDPRELMFGKIIAVSFVLAIQVGVLVGSALLALGKSADLLATPSFVFPPGFFLLAALFLLFGYLLFASAMAAAGALAPNAREATPMTWLLIMPLLPTLLFGSLFWENPDSLIVVGLSLFPFSAPSAMVTRLAVSQVPSWQILASLAGLILTTYLFIVLAARFFRAGNLLSDRSFSLKRMAQEARRQLG